MLRYHIIHTYLLFFNGNHLFASLGSAKADLCCYVRLRPTTPHKNIYYNRLLNQIANKHQIKSTALTGHRVKTMLQQHLKAPEVSGLILLL